MKTTLKQLSKSKVQLTINIDQDELENAEQIALTKLSKNVKVPGFREGRVPAHVAAKHVDPVKLQDQVLNDAISRAVAEAFLKENLQLIDRPEVEVKKFVPGEMLEFTAEAEIVPPIKLGDYKKLTTKPEKVSISAKDVDEVIGRMKENFAERKDVKREAKLDDEVVIDFVGKKDGVAFDGGTSKDYTLQLGSNQFIPGFEDGIVGHKPGEEFDLELDFPKDYHASELAGAKVEFNVTIKAIKELVEPKIDDEFAKKTGAFETLSDLKSDIKRELSDQRQREADQQYRDKLITELVEKSEVSAPEVLVNDQMTLLEQDFERNLSYRGLTVDQYIQTQGYKDIEDWRNKEVRTAAKKRVKSGLVLNELANAEKVTASDEEIDEHLEEHRRPYANNPEALKSFEGEEARRDIANHYVTEKTVQRLVELNSN